MKSITWYVVIRGTSEEVATCYSPHGVTSKHCPTLGHTLLTHDLQQADGDFTPVTHDLQRAGGDVTPVTHNFQRAALPVVRKLYSNGIRRVLRGAIPLASSGQEATLAGRSLCEMRPASNHSAALQLDTEDSVRESGSDFLVGDGHIFVPLSRFSRRNVRPTNGAKFLANQTVGLRPFADDGTGRMNNK